MLDLIDDIKDFAEDLLKGKIVKTTLIASDKKTYDMALDVRQRILKNQDCQVGMADSYSLDGIQRAVLPNEIVIITVRNGGLWHSSAIWSKTARFTFA